MSLTARSPTIGFKRLLSDSDSPDSSPRITRRSRQTRRVKSRICAESWPSQDQEFNSARLQSLFPDMDETVVASVLEQCGNDIEEAIRQLGQLRLSQVQQENNSTRASAHPSPSIQSHSTAELRQGGPDGNLEDASVKGEERIKTPAEWVEGLVQQMGAAKDMQDAKSRAAAELRSFEQTVLRSTHKTTQGKLGELNKENAVLKRAVNILQTRLQEASHVNKQQAQQAEAVVSELQAKVHNLEIANYSLSLHLKQATDTQATQFHQHPDVF